MRVVTIEQMRAADAAAVARGGDTALMRAAGSAIAAAVARLAPNARTLVAFAGSGNNGGDAYAAFACVSPTVRRIVYALPCLQPSAGRRDAEERARRGGVVTRALPATGAAARAALAGADLALDALLGTGSRNEPAPELHAVVDALADAWERVLAIDIPSGIDATTGATAAHCVRARATVTLGAPKIGLLFEPARTRAGTLYVGDLGIAAELADAAGDLRAILDDAEFCALLPQRDAASDKRRSGAPLLVAGSAQFPGAAVLCARGAARAGAGYVTVATTESAAPALRAQLVEEVVVTYDPRDVDAAIAALLDLTARSTAVAIGPGLGLSEATGAIVRGFIAKLERPFVADASALFHLAKHLDVLRGKACVLTPHDGEFARLSGEGTLAPGTRIARIRSFVRRTGATTLLKGNPTLVDDGTTLHANVTGTNALATAGTGDVLSGMIATLLAQGLAPVDAARAGAYWHGLAGRAAARARPVGVVAGDVHEALGRALAAARSRRLPAQLTLLG
ncbi:MAG: NAD(P)H-hydrate dehydratase [Vulcanimicrobiaceae bacterium]